MDRDPFRDADPGFVGRQESAGERDGGPRAYADLATERANQGDVVDAFVGDTTSEALARALDAWNIKMRQKIVDPFGVGVCRKACYINVVVPGQFILDFKDK